MEMLNVQTLSSPSIGDERTNLLWGHPVAVADSSFRCDQRRLGKRVNLELRRQQGSAWGVPQMVQVTRELRRRCSGRKTMEMAVGRLGLRMMYATASLFEGWVQKQETLQPPG